MGPVVISVILDCARTADAKGSIAKVKSRGERGHPCRYHLLIVIGFEKFLFIKISAVGFL